MSESEAREFTFQDGSKVKVWSDGRKYDPDFESYRPVYCYSITGEANYEKFEYVGNDIYGGCNEAPRNELGAQSLFAFLYACQEGSPQVTYGEGENSTLFPEHVRDWAYMNNDEISMFSIELEEHNAGTT